MMFEVHQIDRMRVCELLSVLENVASELRVAIEDQHRAGYENGVRKLKTAMARVRIEIGDPP